MTPASVCVIERGRNPSTDYYVAPRVAKLGVPLVPSPQAGSLVVIVRYLDSGARRRIEALRRELAGIAYFMDDDLLDLAAIRRAPLPYSARMAWLACRHRGWLKRIGARLWVSTPYLAQKYREWSPMLLEPAPPPELLLRSAQAGDSTQLRVFYHGTGLHRDEIRWLAPIIRAVQAKSAKTSFQIFGRGSVRRLFRDIPRASVLYPLDWESYRTYCAENTFHIGLAPLLAHAFNAARSHTRFYDIVRCGAAGIYSDVAPYASFVRQGIDGLLVENHPEAWVDAILRLASDETLRGEVAARARQRAISGN